MRSRGRPIATTNKKNAAYILDYFNKILTFPRDIEVFLQRPSELDEAKNHFQKVKALASTLAELEIFDQEVENRYHLALSRWIDTHLTETGFQRCLNGLNQITYRNNGEKKTHIHIRAEANQALMKIAKRLGLSKQNAIERIIEHAENTL